MRKLKRGKQQAHKMTAAKMVEARIILFGYVRTSGHIDAASYKIVSLYKVPYARLIYNNNDDRKPRERWWQPWTWSSLV